MSVITNTMEWEEVALPLTKGVDLNTRARLVESDKLLSAVNCFFPREGGLEKRLGHTAERVRDISILRPTGPEPETYLYGWGLYNPEHLKVMDSTDDTVESEYGGSGELQKVFTRDNEEIVVDGHRLFRGVQEGFVRPNGNQVIGYAGKHFYHPSCETSTLGKTLSGQSFSSMGDNGEIKVLAFIENNSFRVKCYDSITGAQKFDEYINTGGTDPQFCRVIPTGSFVHVYFSDEVLEESWVIVLNKNSKTLPTKIELGETGTSWDTATIEEGVLFVRTDTAGAVYGTYVNSNGTLSSTLAEPPTQFDVDGDIVDVVSVAVHPVTGDVCLVWITLTGPDQKFCVYTSGFVQMIHATTLASETKPKKVSVTSSYLLSTDGSSIFYAYYDNVDSSPDRKTVCWIIDSDGVHTKLWTLSNCNLAGKAFTVGNAPFVWVCRPTAVQSSFLLIDRFGNPVGRSEYGTAVNVEDSYFLFNTEANGSNYDFHGAFNYKQRTAELEGIYHEDSTREFRLNFAATPSVVQAGRCSYLTGHQLWQYDGSKISEQGFLFYPEEIVYTPATTGGALMTASGHYFYMVYLCHKNAQGEEVRSPAVLSSEVILSGGQNSVSLSIPTIPSCRDDSYFLIYRNANTGTNWHLVSSRDPNSASCVHNNQGTAVMTFSDTMSDAALVSKELDIGTSDNFLMPFAAPSCTLIAQGKNRLWIAGGDIPPGQVWPSRYYQDYETPAFHPGLAITVDRDDDPVTAVGFISNIAFLFKERKGYVIANEGLNNVAVGNNFETQLVLADVGSVSEHVGRITEGLVFLSLSGYKIAGPDGSVKAIGLPVDTVAGDCSAVLIDPVNYGIRCYQSSGSTLVWDYSSGNWTTWTVLATSGVMTENGALLTVGNKLYREANVYTDDSAIYPHSWRTANLAKQMGGFQRARKIAGFGESDKNYKFRVNVYLDEKNYPSQVKELDSADRLNTSVWGDGDWGSGFWGDADGTELFARDSVWRWRFGFDIQRCSCISIEVVYNGPDKGPVHTALVLQIGKRNGLDRIGD